MLSGRVTLLNFAAFLRMISASFVRPLDSNQRGDSGTNLGGKDNVYSCKIINAFS